MASKESGAETTQTAFQSCATASVFGVRRQTAGEINRQPRLPGYCCSNSHYGTGGVGEYRGTQREWETMRRTAL